MLHHAVEQFVAETGTAADEVYRSLDAVQPMGRVGKAEEIAQSIAFLLSHESSFTTGTLFAVDGGIRANERFLNNFSFNCLHDGFGF